jgi:hypothetical protein
VTSAEGSTTVTVVLISIFLLESSA